MIHTGSAVGLSSLGMEILIGMRAEHSLSREEMYALGHRYSKHPARTSRMELPYAASDFSPAHGDPWRV